MNTQEDSVEQAMELLRSESWAAEPMNPELESELMQGFERRMSVARFGKWRTLTVGLAVLAIGAGTFAAAGGVERVKQWLRVTVEIDGKASELWLAPVAEATLNLDTEDGGTALVHIETDASDDGSRTTRVQVTKTGSDGEIRQEAKCVKRIVGGEDPATVSADVLGDAEPLAEWEDEAGRYHELYILPAEEGEGSRILVATTDEFDETTVRLLANTPRSLLADGSVPEVDVSDDGTITITRNHEDGRVERVKLRVRLSPGDEALEDGLRIEMPDGGIKVHVEEVGDGE